MGLLRWLSSSWFLISKDQNKQVHQKDTLDLAIHPNCFKALHDRGCLRLKQAISREFKAKTSLWPDTPPPPPQPSKWVTAMLSLANRPQTLKAFGMTNFKQTHDECTDSPRARPMDHTTLLQPPPPPQTPAKDWHVGPFPPYGKLAQGLSLTMRPNRAASPL